MWYRKKPPRWGVAPPLCKNAVDVYLGEDSSATSDRLVHKYRTQVSGHGALTQWRRFADEVRQIDGQCRLYTSVDDSEEHRPGVC